MTGLPSLLGEAVGNPLYRAMPEHVFALLTAAAVPVAFFLVRTLAARGSGRARTALASYRLLCPTHRFALWLLTLTAATHVGLGLAGHQRWLVPLFWLQAAATGIVALRLLRGQTWRMAAGALLSGSLTAYVVVIIALEPPDQVGLATKLVELAALGVVLAPAHPTRLKRFAATASLIVAVVIVGFAALLGSFTAAERAGGSDHDHGGDIPVVGTVTAHLPDHKPTKAERAATAAFIRRAVRVIKPLAKLSAAERAGFNVGRVRGPDYHAERRSGGDGAAPFDPRYPKALVFAETSRGPLLLGAMWEMPFGKSGPAIGGRLTHWHSHESVCFGLAPPALTGVMSPFGGCPALSLGIPRTPEMIHLWTVPGHEPWFGELDDHDLRRAIDEHEARRS